MERNMNILLTSAGRRSYIVDYFKQCQGVGKVFASNSAYTIALERADGHFISPLIYADNYISSIIDFCKENDVNMVLSLFDIDLLVLAKNEEKFREAGIELVLAPADFVELCNDKWKTYLFVESLGLQSPKTYLHLDDVLKAVEKGELAFPVLMKPRWGMASMGIYKVENEEELRVFTEKSKRDIFNSYLKYESAMTADEAIIYQEVMTGKEFGLDVINDLQGHYVATCAKQKVSMRSGETDLGLTCDPVPFEAITKTIAAHSNHHGICSVDCFQNERGIFIIEMNCRISGHYPLSHLAGFNYPQLLVDWYNGKQMDRANLTFKTGLYIIKDLVPTILKNE